VVYVHGWMGSGDLDLSTLAVRGAYLDRRDHNVLSIDWSYYAENVGYHITVIPQMKIVSFAFAARIDKKTFR
jgi:pimeloyl-ACP methyl ester carboxylesterase